MSRTDHLGVLQHRLLSRWLDTWHLASLLPACFQLTASCPPGLPGATAPGPVVVAAGLGTGLWRWRPSVAGQPAAAADTPRRTQGGATQTIVQVSNQPSFSFSINRPIGWVSCYVHLRVCLSVYPSPHSCIMKWSGMETFCQSQYS